VAVLGVAVTDRTPFAAGARFGEVGSYELLRARATVVLDPSIEVNRAVVDLESATRSASGLVEAESDVLVLRPTERHRGNGCLLCVVPNRGTTGGIPFNVEEPPRFGAEPGVHPGDGWLLRAGWTLSWIGWQWDVPRTDGRLGCSVPEVVDEEGWPLEGPVRVELQPLLSPVPSLPLRSASDLTGTLTCYPAADLEQRDAVLQVAVRRGESFLPVPRSQWQFAHSARDGSPVPDRESLWLAGGFRPDLVYQARYRTNRCPLVGAGLAVFRDVARHLLADEDHLDHGFAVGWSQSGRFLRQFLLDGFNADEGGRQVFDAVLPFIAGASRGEFNQRYGQPSEALAEGSSLRPPFGMGDLLATDNGRGTAPKVVSVDSASEYWRGHGSVIPIEPQGRDRPVDHRDTREYYLAGTEHLGGTALDLEGPGPPRNCLSVSAFNRAALELTRRWVVDGDAPPPSRLPRRNDGTAVPRRQALDHFAAVTGLVVPEEGNLLSPRPASEEFGFTGRVYVSALDRDGNEVAGIRHPELSVPLATHTGWNLLLTEGTRWAALAAVTGNSLPFPQQVPAPGTRDQRRSITQRYRNLDDYATQLEAAADLLVTEGFLLAEDVGRIVAAGRANFEVITGLRTGRQGS
jgi:hypothetical protein